MTLTPMFSLSKMPLLAATEHVGKQPLTMLPSLHDLHYEKDPIHTDGWLGFSPLFTVDYHKEGLR